MRRPSQLHAKRISAFSLLEVLVASLVLSVVMAVLLSALSTTLSLWRTTESKIASDREGRSAELLLAQDVAGAIMPANPELWPRVVNGHLQFLTTKPPDYQKVESGDLGDICLVEYSVEPDSYSLVRRFFGSRQTFEILQNNNNALPSPPTGGADPQIVATNLLKDMYDAVRGLTFYRDPLRRNFVILDQQLAPLNSPYTPDNPPAAVEVNLAVAEPDAIINEDLLSKPGYILRNAGFYSFRLGFPKLAP